MTRGTTSNRGVWKAKLVDVEDVDDHWRVGGDVGGDGVVAPEVDPGVGGAQGEIGFHQTGREEGEPNEDDGEQGVGEGIVEGPIFEDVKGGVAESAEDYGRGRGRGQLQIAGKENGVDENHDRETGTEKVGDEGERATEQHLMSRQFQETATGEIE